MCPLECLPGSMALDSKVFPATALVSRKPPSQAVGPVMTLWTPVMLFLGPAGLLSTRQSQAETAWATFPQPLPVLLGSWESTEPCQEPGAVNSDS